MFRLGLEGRFVFRPAYDNAAWVKVVIEGMTFAKEFRTENDVQFRIA